MYSMMCKSDMVMIVAYRQCRSLFVYYLRSYKGTGSYFRIMVSSNENSVEITNMRVRSGIQS